MARKNLNLRIDDEGNLEVVDPGYDTLDLIHSINQGFEVKTSPLPFFSVPRFLTLRVKKCGLSSKELTTKSDEELWRIHDTLVDNLTFEDIFTQSDEKSILDLKIELAYRLLKSCHLCGRHCGVNRTNGEKGVCDLGMGANVFEHFVHIAEESPINPSIDLFLYGCGLQCVFCQQAHLLQPSLQGGDLLTDSFWKNINDENARSLSFVGGNPDESLYPILRFLSGAPVQWELPIVWNCNAYASPHTVKLLSGVVDAFVPDCKFGNSDCGDELAHAANYWEMAQDNISAMLKQKVPVIVRVLLLPGHYQCCQLPIFRFLAEQSRNRQNLYVSIRDQYCPNQYEDSKLSGEMNRKIRKDEVLRAYHCAENLHLPILKDH